MAAGFGDGTFGAFGFGGGAAVAVPAVGWTIEIGFTDGTLVASPTWTDVTPWVRSFSTRRGRNHELGKTSAGTAAVILDNRDRRFDPTNTSGPYYPNILPMRHIRIRSVLNGLYTYDVFRGFIEDWGQQWGGPAAAGAGDATVEVQAVDAFKVLQLATCMTPNAVASADGALGYWPLDDAPAVGAIAPVVNGTAPMTKTTVPSFLGVAGPMLGGAPAVTSSYTGSSGVGSTATYQTSDDLGEDWFLSDADFSIEGWFYPDATFPSLIISALTDGFINAQLGLGTSGGAPRIQANFGLGGSVGYSTGSLSVAWHHVAVTRAASSVSYYIDGVLDSVRTAAPTPRAGTVNAVQIAVGGKIGGGLGNAIAHVGFYSYALTAEQIAGHAAIDCGRFPPQSSGVAINALLDSVGWPAGLRAIGTGASTVMLVPDGATLDLMQQVAEDTEHGILAVAPDGVVTFVGRDTLESLVSSVTTFGDAGTEIRYRDLELSYDDQDLWTEVNSSGAEGTVPVVASDPASQITYGRRVLSNSTIAATQNEVLAQASGLLNRYKAPAVRPQTLQLYGQQEGLTDQVGRELGDRVTVKRRPPGGGTITVEALIEGINQDVGVDGWPQTTFALVPPFSIPWILGDATYGVLGSTTDLGW